MSRMQPPCQTLKAHLRAEDRREPKNGHKTCQSGRLESSRRAPYDGAMAGIAAGRPPLKIGSFQPPTRVFLAPMGVSLRSKEYVLSWRWDCEQTPQVWNSCADVTIA